MNAERWMGAHSSHLKRCRARHQYSFLSRCFSSSFPFLGLDLSFSWTDLLYTVSLLPPSLASSIPLVFSTQSVCHLFPLHPSLFLEPLSLPSTKLSLPSLSNRFHPRTSPPCSV
ncbi:hypothetical protein BDV98DRAFT_575713 [Pterulicium gracile]|uniref:Uncharacterized protein n=1 Tax=Pterulicium gracile TaxID=1884261 RepID=A0A5C3Q589_9AGAR|nr:hypothetical protein BDV98DRAFT_575713 [Pterula gracilis]